MVYLYRFYTAGALVRFLYNSYDLDLLSLFFSAASGNYAHALYSQQGPERAAETETRESEKEKKQNKPLRAPGSGCWWINDDALHTFTCCLLQTEHFKL